METMHFYHIKKYSLDSLLTFKIIKSPGLKLIKSCCASIICDIRDVQNQLGDQDRYLRQIFEVFLLKISIKINEVILCLKLSYIEKTRS